MSYYKTQHWMEFTERVKDERSHCERCGVDREEAREEGRPLQTHHKHYNSVGEEDDEDVEVLCKDCHREEHGNECEGEEEEEAEEMDER